MSDEGLGDVALSVYNKLHNPNRRTYLKRNVRQVLHSLIQMGSAASNLRPSVGVRPQEPSVAPVDSDENDEDDEPQPVKRRRLFDDRSSSSKHFDDDMEVRRPLSQAETRTNRASPWSLRPESMKPHSLHGTPKPFGTRPKSSKMSIQKLLPETPVDFSESMRIDIYRINPDQEEAIDHDRGKVFDIPCRCSIAILYAENDENPGDMDASEFLDICKEVKACTLRVAINYDGTVAREVILSEPFVFSPLQFYVNRKWKLNGEWVREFGFAERYRVKIKLELIGFHETWPPIGGRGSVSNLIDLGFISTEDTHLCCEANPFADTDRHARAKLHLGYKTVVQAIRYNLEVQIRWAYPSYLRDVEAKNARSAIGRTSSPGSKVPELPESLGKRQIEDFAVQKSPGSSRVSRKRTAVPTYNLKALSIRTQKMSPRGPRTNKLEQRNLDRSGIVVLYSFNRAGARGGGNKRETTITGLKCLFCLSRSSTLEQLRFHLHTDHDAFKFHIRQRQPDSSGVTYHIEIHKNDRPGPALFHGPHRTVQLGPPVSLFDLEKYLGGDDSWTQARSGILHNRTHLDSRSRGTESSLSPSPYGSRHSSPNTSTNTDDLIDPEKDEVEDLLPIRQKKAFYVPRIRKPVYDPITKQLLRTGDEIRNTADETDEAWIHQRQRDGLNDFTDEDVLPEEKEFIHQWNSFIMNQRLTSNKFHADVIVRFVETNKAWIVEKMPRRCEFMKQAENFLLKGVLDERRLRHCLGIIEAEGKAMAARRKANRRQDVDLDRMDNEKSLKTLPTRPLQTCICGERQPVDRVTCRGAVSHFQIRNPVYISPL